MVDSSLLVGMPIISRFVFNYSWWFFAVKTSQKLTYLTRLNSCKVSVVFFLEGHFILLSNLVWISTDHLLFCWGHYGSPLSRCWSVLAAHICSSTPADKCHLSRWSQRSWLGLLEGQVDNSDVYSQTAPQSLAPAGMVMPSGNEWIGGSHRLYHMPRSDPTLAPEKNGKKN